MIHHKVIVCGPMLGGPVWGTEFDSESGAVAAVAWLRGKGYDATNIPDHVSETDVDFEEVDRILASESYTGAEIRQLLADVGYAISRSTKL